MAKELLFSVTKKDLEIEFFSGTGAGGQYRNKHQNCVRLKHPASGTLVTGQSNRERPANIKEAMNNMINSTSFKIWHAQKVFECLSGETVEQRVQKAMTPENLKIEGKDSAGRWVKLRSEELSA